MIAATSTRNGYLIAKSGKLNWESPQEVSEMATSRGSLKVAQVGAERLADRFKSPFDSARPQTFWHWMNGNITKEGITVDLEAMKGAGIGTERGSGFLSAWTRASSRPPRNVFERRFDRNWTIPWRRIDTPPPAIMSFRPTCRSIITAITTIWWTKDRGSCMTPMYLKRLLKGSDLI